MKNSIAASFVLVCFFALLTKCSQSFADPVATPSLDPADAPSAAEIAQLIEQLGHKTFAQREASANQLVQLGSSARPAIRTALKSADAEVRWRAKRILTVINERDFQDRLTAFAADINDEHKLTMPGWTRFRKVIGDQRDARELFVEMQRAEPKLLDALESQPESINDLLGDRVREISMNAQFGNINMRSPTGSVGATAAMLFVGSDSAITIANDVALQLSYSIQQQPQLISQFNSPRGTLLKKLLGQWVSRETQDAQLVWQNVSMATNYNLPEGLPLARAALAKANLPPHVKQQTIMLLMRNGSKRDIAILEPLLQDTALISTFNAKGLIDTDTVKVSDMAMAAMIQMAGQKHKEFGMERAQVANNTGIQIQTISFKTEDDRQAAIKKWSAWWAEHQGEFKGESTPVDGKNARDAK